MQELERYVASLDAAQKTELDTILHKELTAAWLPEPENQPQVSAYYSLADLLLYGGAAGAGKTSLVVGVAITCHEKSVIFRAKAVDLRGVADYLLEVAGGRDGWNGSDKILRRPGITIELSHLEKPGSERSHQGRPRDFIGFDEGAQLSRQKVQFVLGWLRSSNPKQRRRCIIASNPPTGGDGEWLIEWFAPWLDPTFPHPAKSGELRWAATAPDREGTTIWLPDGRPIVFLKDRDWRLATPGEIEEKNKDVVAPLTRTFIPGRLDDNPYLANTGYRAQLQTLPEPLRSQMLHGNFLAGRQDHEWQVIPTQWVKAAMDRWTPEPPNNAAMTAIGVDVAQGGADKTVLAPRHGPWFAPLIVKPGIETPTGSEVAALVVLCRRNNAKVIIDVGGGYGGAAKMWLKDNEIDSIGFNGANESGQFSKDKQLSFVNKRSETHWRFREALDPGQDGGSPIAIPPSPTILADLTAPRWKLTARGIQIESKEDLKKSDRLGRSPDEGDSIVIAWSEGERALIAAERKKARGGVNLMPTPRNRDTAERGTGWMSR